MQRGAIKVWQINGVKVVVTHLAPSAFGLGWSAQHWRDGYEFLGHDASLSNLRKGVHYFTNPNN